MKYIVRLNSKIYEVDVDESDAVLTSVSDVRSTETAPAAAQSTAQATSAEPTGDGVKVISPMPGNILKVNVKVGDPVKRGQVIMILEAMKMENEIVAPRDGVIKQLLVAQGSTVETDAVLALI